MEVVENIEQIGQQVSEGIPPTNQAEIHNPSEIKAFTTKQAVSALSIYFFSESTCREWVIQNLHPEGYFCPACEVMIADHTTKQNFKGGRRCKCKHCGKWFSAFTGTFLQECQLDEQRIFILAVLTELNVHKNEIGRLLNINPATVRIWQKKFKTIKEINE